MQKPAAHVIFDFDFTLVSTESVLDVLDLALSARRVDASETRVILLAAAERIRAGSGSTKDVFHLAKALLGFRRSDFEAYVRQAQSKAGDTVNDVFSALQSEGVDIQILSASYRDLVVPLATHWGVPAEKVTANRLFWIGDRPVMVLPSSLHRTEGKRCVIASWRKRGRFTAPVIIVGDSLADYLPYRSGLVDGFVSADYYSPQILEVEGYHVRRAVSLTAVVPAVRSLLEDLVGKRL